VNERDEAQVDRPLLLGDAPVRTAPRPKQGPAAFHGVDMHLTEPSAIVVAGTLARGVTDGLMGVTPLGQPGIEILRIGVHHCPWGSRAASQRLDGRLLDIRQPPDDARARALEHAQDRRLLLLQRPAPPRPRQPAASGGPAVVLPSSGGP
jgi:hypothetical protein